MSYNFYISKTRLFKKPLPFYRKHGFPKTPGFQNPDLFIKNMGFQKPRPFH